MPTWYSMRVRRLPTSYLLNWPRRFGRDERPTGRRAARPGRTAGAGALGTLQELRQVLTAAGPSCCTRFSRWQAPGRTAGAALRQVLAQRGPTSWPARCVVAALALRQSSRSAGPAGRRAGALGTLQELR